MSDASTLQATKRNAIFGQQKKTRQLRISRIRGESKICKMIFVYEDNDDDDGSDCGVDVAGDGDAGKIVKM